MSDIQGENGKMTALATPKDYYLSSQPPASEMLMLSEDGILYGWGYGAHATCSGVSIQKTPIHAEKKAKDIRFFEQQAFVLYEDGTIQAWGSNGAGTLGIGEETG